MIADRTDRVIHRQENTVAGKNAETIRCTAIAETIGDRTIARLPESASAALPSRGQVAVTGTVNGTTVTTVVEPDGRKGHWLNLDAIAGVRAAAGSTVSIELTPTKDWPETTVPDDLGAALGAAPDIADVWTDITPMARWEWVRWVGATRNPATRAKRVDVSISKLRDGKRRPCCFDLASCTDPELARSGKLIEAES